MDNSTAPATPWWCSCMDTVYGSTGADGAASSTGSEDKAVSHPYVDEWDTKRDTTFAEQPPATAGAAAAPQSAAAAAAPLAAAPAATPPAAPTPLDPALLGAWNTVRHENLDDFLAAQGVSRFLRPLARAVKLRLEVALAGDVVSVRMSGGPKDDGIEAPLGLPFAHTTPNGKACTITLRVGERGELVAEVCACAIRHNATPPSRG